MLSIGDVQVFVSDFELALRFWGDGLGLLTTEREVTPHSAYARLDFPDGGPAITLIGPVEPWAPQSRPPLGTRPTVRFDVTTSDFDGVLSRLLECGGGQEGEIETYDDRRVVTLADPDGNTFELIEVLDDDFDE